MMYDIPSGMYNAKLHFDKERVQSDNVITRSSILLKKGFDLKIKKKLIKKKTFLFCNQHFCRVFVRISLTFCNAPLYCPFCILVLSCIFLHSDFNTSVSVSRIYLLYMYVREIF